MYEQGTEFRNQKYKAKFGTRKREGVPRNCPLQKLVEENANIHLDIKDVKPWLLARLSRIDVMRTWS